MFYSPEAAIVEASRLQREAEMAVRSRIATRQCGEAFRDLGNAADLAALAFVTFTKATELAQ